MVKALGSGVVPCGVVGGGVGWAPGQGKRSWNSTQKWARKNGREAHGRLESMDLSCWVWGRGQRDFSERLVGEGMTETGS